MNKSKFKQILLLLTSLIWGIAVKASAQDQELRGVWLAWAGANYPSKERVAEIMSEIAAANFNTVYVDVWRYGYPYFHSDVFFQHTGVYTDPALEDGRDILEEAIAEGHLNGLHVEAWFEYGFVAGQVDEDLIYENHPEWFAQKRDGSILFNGDLEYKWISHTNSEGQQFLIDLVQEVIEKYDVDGVELDRIRYPELDCGYDSATVELYRAEHDGQDPPQNIADNEWMRWRADKLSEFVAAAYDSFKAVYPSIPVSNAPIVYPFGYENFCQDWRPWINDHGLDFVTPQVYRLTSSQYLFELDLQLGHVDDPGKFFPGITTVANGQDVETGELIIKIEETRARGLGGHVIWFVDTVEDDLDSLAATVYSNAAEHPLFPPDRRRPPIIVDELDADGVSTSEGWTIYKTIPGYNGSSLFADGSSDEWIEYYADIELAGWYEVYGYLITHWNAMNAAPFELFDVDGASTIAVDQTKEGHRRWHKLDDVYLEAGDSQLLVRLTNDGAETNLVFADAIMLLNSNRSELHPVGLDDTDTPAIPSAIHLYQNYPNPFNPATQIRFELPIRENISLRIYDITGKLVRELLNGTHTAGEYTVTWDGTNQSGRHVSSGVYFYRLQSASYLGGSTLGHTSELKMNSANAASASQVQETKGVRKTVQTRKMILLR